MSRLRERQAEIEQAMLARVHGVSDPAQVGDPEYALGLKEAVAAGLDHAIAAIEAARREHAPIPDRLLAQARAAARNEVGLDTVIRRYLTAYALLGDFLICVAEEGDPVSAVELRRALRVEAATFDRLLTAVSKEYARYAREVANRPRNAKQRRAERVRMLLAGEPVDPELLRYELDAWHLAAIACGPGAAESLRELSPTLDRSLLLLCPEEEVVWAWWGGRSRLSVGEVLALAERSLPGDAALALGEPGRGTDGWRLTHHQAKAAMSVAKRGEKRRVRYAEAALLAAALGDEVLESSLREIYLAPLQRERDGGALLRQTLAAYFGAGRNASSAAASLGVSRKTVSIRLRNAAELIGNPLDTCAAALETALKLSELHQDRVARHRTQVTTGPQSTHIGTH